MKITITLEQLERFLNKLKPYYTARNVALHRLADILRKSLKENVFTTHDDTLHIPTIDELKRLIKTGSKPQKGKPYSKEYLERKRKEGGLFLPHVYENYNFYYGTEVVEPTGEVKMKTEPLSTSTKDFDYLRHHEERRSVLKTAFFRVWQDIIKEVIETYASEAQK